MPFGLKNAGMTFQRMMAQIFFDLPCVFVYLDNLLVASRSIADHRHHLHQVLLLLQQNGLVINREKCVFGVTSFEFLGHQVQAGGVSPLQDRVTVVKRLPRPACVMELQAFLGLINYYRRFIPAAARILKPLTDALQGQKSQKMAISWRPSQRQHSWTTPLMQWTSPSSPMPPLHTLALCFSSGGSSSLGGPWLFSARS
jgi:hypothetical protein